MNKNDCAICQNPLEQNQNLEATEQREAHQGTEIIATECDHLFHLNCLVNWIKTDQNCPVCGVKLPAVINAPVPT